MSFENKTAFISGASRGIGKAIAMRLAEEGANIIIAAKTVVKHPKLEGTIYTAAADIEAAGGKALPIKCDIRNEEEIIAAVNQGAAHFGGIDMVINNASAIALTNIENTVAKRFDLMHSINIRGTFFVSKACIPYLKKSANPHILTLSPPINLKGSWLARHTVYTISKYGMTMVANGLADELKPHKIASNTLWPETTIATAAVKNLLGGEEMMRRSRTPDIMADTAYYILRRNSAECTGNNFIDVDVLAQEGVADIDQYLYDPSHKGDLQKDLFLD